MPAKSRELNGYTLVYLPDHPRCMTSKNWFGYVYEHIVLAEKLIGRSLRADEHVHHLDLDRSNNRPENLLVLEGSQHTKLHNWLAKGAPMVKAVGVNGVNSGKSKVNIYCVVCGEVLKAKQKRFCSKSCSATESAKRTSKKPVVTQLVEDISSMSWAAIGRKYGVSDNAVRKWARSYGLL